MSSASTPTEPTFTERSFRAIGTIATVIVPEPWMAEDAEKILRDDMDDIDLACSRFRPDSELEHLHAHAGSTVRVSALLFEALEIALNVAEKTFGAVDPTVGNAIIGLGYDRDFDNMRENPLPPSLLGPVAGYWHIHLNRRHRTARIPKGVRIDLGSSAKAFAADRSAARIAQHLHAGVLVSIGGDIAVSGPPPPGGWAIGIAVDSSTRGTDVDQVVAIRSGGLASSSTSVRTWLRGNERVHHIIDPSTGLCVPPYWTLVSAAGSSCVDANALSTASVVWGEQALCRVGSYGQAVRLVRHDGHVFTVGGWPEGDGA
jgi:thiamine biosynthesis lipoprotein